MHGPCLRRHNRAQGKSISHHIVDFIRCSHPWMLTWVPHVQEGSEQQCTSEDLRNKGFKIMRVMEFMKMTLLHESAKM